jgi:hypothetical protein
VKNNFKTMRYTILIITGLILFSCNRPVKQAAVEEEKPLPPTGTFGKAITHAGALPAADLLLLMDTVENLSVKLSGDITASCQGSGCWMELGLSEGNTLRVTFRDDSFVIPKDAAGKKAVVKGTAVKELIPVEMLRHWAEDEGKTKEEIEAITEPAWKYSFVADGVIIE